MNNNEFLKVLEKRRSYYSLSKNIDSSLNDESFIQLVNRVVELTPDAFDMKSARVLLLLNEKHDELWLETYKLFEGKVPLEKINSFKNGKGTVLFFIDTETVEAYKAQYPRYASNFDSFSLQANAMLQINIRNSLVSLKNVGANIQHYNPIIDEMVQNRFDVPSSYKLIAEMVFGNIEAMPGEKEKEDIDKRVKVIK